VDNQTPSTDLAAEPLPFPPRLSLPRLEQPAAGPNGFPIGELTSALPGGNRPQRGRRTQLILPVSNCGTNA
jgi:hypothetical protein